MNNTSISTPYLNLYNESILTDNLSPGICETETLFKGKVRLQIRRFDFSRNA